MAIWSWEAESSEFVSVLLVSHAVSWQEHWFGPAGNLSKRWMDCHDISRISCQIIVRQTNSRVYGWRACDLQIQKH